MKPASTIVEALGGEVRVAQIAGLRSGITPYPWRYPKHKGDTDGIIPCKPLSKPLEYARQDNIRFAAEVFLSPELKGLLSATEHGVSP